MYDHIGLKVKSLDASVRFYAAALAPLGYVLSSRDDSGDSDAAADSDAIPLLTLSSAIPIFSPLFRRKRAAGAAPNSQNYFSVIRLLYTASTNIAVVHGPVLAP